MSLLTAESSALQLKYKSDDMDDLLEGVITNKHQDHEQNKPKGAVDSLVQEAYEKAMTETNQSHLNKLLLKLDNQPNRNGLNL